MICDNESYQKAFGAYPLQGDFRDRKGVCPEHQQDESRRWWCWWLMTPLRQIGWWNDGGGGEAGESPNAGRWWGVGGHVQNSSMNDLKAGDGHI